MSTAVWRQCGLPLDPSIKIALTSANGETGWSLGLCRNIPFNFKGLEVLLQVHVVEHATYDVLLGRPFSMLCETKIDNRSNGEQILTIRNPNTGMETVIPTHERGKRSSLGHTDTRAQTRIFMSRVRPMTHTQIFLKRGPIFPLEANWELSISGRKTTIGFLFTDTLAHIPAADGSTAHIDVTSIPGYAISINAITENQVKHTDGLDLSQPYIRNAREIANNQYDTPLCTLSSFASAPADFSQPITGSNVSSIPTSLPSFSILQYVDQASRTLIHGTVRSGQRRQRTHLPSNQLASLRSHAPSRRKRSTKRLTSVSNLYPRRYLKEFRIIREITGDPLADIPILSTHPPDFHPTGRYTQENHDIIEENHPGDFLWPDERKLMHHFHDAARERIRLG